MREVHIHPDGFLFVRTPGVTYADTLENAALDFGEKIPALSDGADDLIYAPGVRHALMHTERGLVGGGPLQWDFGDRLIAAVDRMVAAQSVRKGVEDAERQRQFEQRIADSMAGRPILDDVVAVLSDAQKSALAQRIAQRDAQRIAQRIPRR